MPPLEFQSPSAGLVGRAPSAGLLMRRGGAVSYTDKVLSIQSANLISYWPLSETSGTTADNAEGTAARDGTFARNVTTMGTSVGIGDGNTAPIFTPGSDVCNIYTASFASAFNGAECTIAGWLRADSWTDSTQRYVARLLVSGATYIYFRKSATNNRIEMARVAGGVGSLMTKASVSSLDWIHVALTISQSGSLVKGYVDGASFANTSTLGTWAGSLTTTDQVIGAANNTSAIPWDGGAAHWAVWTKALSDVEILELSKKN